MIVSHSVLISSFNFKVNMCFYFHLKFCLGLLEFFGLLVSHLKWSNDT